MENKIIRDLQFKTDWINEDGESHEVLVTVKKAKLNMFNRDKIEFNPILVDDDSNSIEILEIE